MKTIHAKVALLIMVGTAGCLFSGCFGTSSELINLRDDMSQLQMKINELQQNQADLSVKMDTLTSKLDPLTAELQETQSRMSLLGQRLDDMESNISAKMNILSEKISGSQLPTAPSPSEMFAAAYADYSGGKYDLAIKGLTMYLEKYPNTENASKAQYYLGESYLSQKDTEHALQAFQAVKKSYPKSAMVAASMLKEASVLELQGKKKEASETFHALMKAYPNSPEASTAREKLESYKNNAK